MEKINNMDEKKLFLYLVIYNTSNICILFLGFAVFTTKQIDPNAFICEYAGEIILEKEGYIRQNNYKSEDGSFLFFFQDLW